MVKILKYVCGVIFILSLNAYAGMESISKVQWVHTPQVQRLIFSDVSADSYHVFTLTSPHRLVVDFKNARLRADVMHFDFAGTKMKAVRVGWPKSGVLRVVFDLEAPVHVESHWSGSALWIDIDKSAVALNKPAAEITKPAYLEESSTQHSGGPVSQQTRSTEMHEPLVAVKSFSIDNSNSVSKNNSEKTQINSSVSSSRYAEPQGASQSVQNSRIASGNATSTTPALGASTLTATPAVHHEPVDLTQHASAEVASVKPMSETAAPVKPTSILSTQKKIESSLNAAFARGKEILVAPEKHDVLVAIDPGHGGKDQGTEGEHGTKEKDVVLSIAERLAALINKQPHMHAILTRNGDYFLYLRDRLRIARQEKADLFISIHADSYLKEQLAGASVYALSRHGATSEAARWLAQSVNTSELGGVNLNGIGDDNYVLRSVLIDLAQTATIVDSLRLGQDVLRGLHSVTKLHYPEVEQAPFVVLKSPDIPSILVETGFLSNPSEEEHLRDKAYQEKLAQAILGGVLAYTHKGQVA